MSYLSIGDNWPPTQSDRNRIAKYKENKQLFKGSHQEVFKTVQRTLEDDDRVAMTYLVTNYCGLLSKLSADMLFGESPNFSAKNETADEYLQQMIQSNKLYTGLYESALGNSYRGDACYKVRYAKRSEYKDEREIIIEPQNPNYFFVEQSNDNIRQVNRQIIAWEYFDDDEETKYLKVEVHEPGTIYHYLYKLGGGRVIEELDVTDYYDVDEIEKTGVDDFVVVHIPNWRDDETFWGYSDYLDIKSLQDEANNRISQISRVLDKHADPKMKGPREALDKNDRIEVSGSKYFPYTKDSAEPKYMTWNAELDMAFKQIDEILKMMFLVTETSPDAFGLSEGSMADSGIALKYRLMRLLSKISRKKRYYDDAIKHLLVVAQKMQNNYTDASYEPETPSADWRDGIPDDPKENAETTEILARAKSVSIEERVRMNHPEWSEKKITEEVERIKSLVDSEQSTAPFLT